MKQPKKYIVYVYYLVEYSKLANVNLNTPRMIPGTYYEGEAHRRLRSWHLGRGGCAWVQTPGDTTRNTSHPLLGSHSSQQVNTRSFIYLLIGVKSGSNILVMP